jgi:hypothetical protein
VTDGDHLSHTLPDLPGASGKKRKRPVPEDGVMP